MPVVKIEDMPDESRVWVFGSDRPVHPDKTGLLLEEVDRFLEGWKAHGSPLTVARSWKHDRFLTIAVDQSAAGASGCSIDGLYRTLKTLEPGIGVSLVTSGVVFYRAEGGNIVCSPRDRFAQLGSEGKVSASTEVFDPTVTSLGEWRARFELKAGESWHAGLLGDGQPA